VSGERGTLELLLRQLAMVLSPLTGALEPANAPTFFTQLGIPLSTAQAGTLAASLAPAGTKIRSFLQVSNDVDLAMDGSGVSATLSLDAVTKLKGAIDALSDIAAAIGGLGLPGVTISAIPGRLLNHLLVLQLGRQTALNELLEFAGILERQDVNVASSDPDQPFYTVETFHFDRIRGWLENATAQLQSLYGWGDAAFDGNQLLAMLEQLLARLGVPIFRDTSVVPPALDAVLIEFQPRTTVNPRGLVVRSRAEITSGVVELAEADWKLGVNLGFTIPSGTEVLVQPNWQLTVKPPDGTTMSGDVRWTGGIERDSTHPLLIIGQVGGTRIEATAISARAGATLTWDGAAGVARATPAAELELRGARFVLGIGAGGALLTTLIPKDAVHAALDLGLGWSEGRLYLRGSAALQATFPVGLSLGPVELQSLTIGLAPGAGAAMPVELSATVQTTLGPLSMLIERVGLVAKFDFPPGNGGNLGPLDLALAFKAPTGIGLALDAGPVSGGGYLALDPNGQRYAGVLQLKITFISAVAFGIYEQVEGRPAFVAVLGVRFSPGIQLGLGFALTGVGGLVGLNRRANTDMLRERLASGAAGNVLFCEDPVRNAPAILGDLAAFFPPAAGGFLVGPTLQISWLSPIIRLDIGILLEFPGPSKIVILGTVRAVIGAGDALALLYLRMDVLGVLDFAQRLVSIDAALVASHALGAFRLTGGMAFRLAYGDNPYVLLSIGGFHPRFDPGPLNIPRLARVGASLDVAVVARLYVRLELYTAFTSNTLQAGAKVEAGLELGPLDAHGFFQFDALIQFRPFHFEAEFAAGFSVEVYGFSLASVDIAGQISGPGPVVIHAEGTVRRLGLKVSGSATFELGSHDGDQPAPIAHPVLELAPELQQLTNLRAEGEDRSVVLRPGRPAVSGALVSPLGSLVWDQKRAPLATLIHRLGGVPLDAAHELHLDPPPGWSAAEEQDWFSPGTFTDLDLKASQTLNNAGFQELPSGIRLAGGAHVRAPSEVAYQADVELVKRPERTRVALIVGTYLSSALQATIRDRTTTPAVDPGPVKVAVVPEKADVHAVDGALLHAAQTPFQAFQLARGGTGRIAVPTTDVAVSL
jgi:hypothetical protein